MIELTTQEIMTLIGLCSKACVIDPNKISFDRPLEMVRFVAARDLVIPILSRLDNEYPGLMPVPHDGVAWKDRVWEMSENCEHVYENTGLVLCTMPETAVQACVKCGKQRGHQKEIEDQKQPTDLECDICGHTMMMQKDEDKVYFSCGNPSCEQNWCFEENDSSCTVLKHLWPSRMEEGSKMYREGFLPDWIEKKEFHANAMFTAGFLDSADRDFFIQECRDTLDKWHVEHPLKKRPWWHFWKENPLKNRR